MKYRAEIDGLRAVAVLPVILFHAGFSMFSGGFVGVDVFFVISGYLITTILMDDIESNTFSAASFYERRARRILPALIFVMLCCVPFALLMFNNEQMHAFIKSVISTSLFSSNFLFWSESGYFDSNALLKPLLHTWSLAVEEQYYILFPPFLYLVYRFAKKYCAWVMLLLACISFALAEWALGSHPEAAFFLLPMRAWELLVGTGAAFVLRRNLVQGNNLLSLTGIVLVIYSMLAYDESTPFPGWYALAPVVGSWLIIVFARSSTYVARLLSAKVLVGIGLISYSAYLWHQPILVFARLKFMTYDLPLSVKLIVIPLVLILAWLSWKYVESPFRKKLLLKGRKSLLVAGATVSIAISAVGYLFLLNPIATLASEVAISKGENAKFNLSQLKGEAAFKYIGLARSSKWNNAFVFLPLNNASGCKVLILGDSHAGHFSRGFAQVLVVEKGCEVHVMVSTGCPPLFDHYKIFDVNQKNAPFRQNACMEQVDIWKSFVLEHGSEYNFVILSSRWNWLVNDMDYAGKKIRMDSVLPVGMRKSDINKRFDYFASGLADTVETISSIGVNTVFFSQPPVQLLDLRDFDSWEAYEKARPRRVDAIQRQIAIDKIVKVSGVCLNSKFTYARTFDFFCPEDDEYCGNRQGDKSFYLDDDHLSVNGSYAVGKWFIENYPSLFDGLKKDIHVTQK